GWQYRCSPTSSLQSATGTGWIPVNFKTTGVVSLSSLPTDPVNASSSNLYYTYVSGGSFELNGILESAKYRSNTSLSKPNLPGVLSYGSNQALSPLYNTSGLVGYWNFDEGTGAIAKDTSGNGNNGTLTNGPVWTSGKVGGALSFNGVNNGVQTSDNDVLDIRLGSMSWGMWFKTSTSTSETMYRKSDAANANGIIVSVNAIAGKVRFWVSSIGISVDSSLSSYNNGDWYYAVGVLNRSDNTLKIYMNGIFANSLDASLLSASDFNSGGGVWIANSAPQFAGSLDDVRVYSRALSSSEIFALYNATK
ncbi:MAG: LamG domain-containing protein, partial [Candidatus Paceibacterota bacterium]